MMRRVRTLPLRTGRHPPRHAPAPRFAPPRRYIFTPPLTDRMMKLHIGIAAAFLITAASGSASEVSRRESFALSAACARVSLEVGNLSEDGTKIGLRKADIETAVRSRLRAARLYLDINAAPVLVVFVHVHGSAYSIDLEFWKVVEDKSSWSRMLKGIDRLYGFASTWETGNIGTHGGNSGHVLSAIGRYTDKFIDEYLRVNAPACKGEG